MEKCYLLVLVNVNRLQLTESNQVCADKNTQFTAFLFTLLAVAGMSLVLHAHPELVHLSKVELNEVNRVFDTADVRVTATNTTKMS